MISSVGDVNCFHDVYVLLLLLSDVRPLTDNQTLNVNQEKQKKNHIFPSSVLTAGVR